MRSEHGESFILFDLDIIITCNSVCQIAGYIFAKLPSIDYGVEF